MSAGSRKERGAVITANFAANGGKNGKDTRRRRKERGVNRKRFIWDAPLRFYSQFQFAMLS